MSEEKHNITTTNNGGDNQESNEQSQLVPNIVVEIKNHDSQLFHTCYDTIKGWIEGDMILDTTNILAFTVRVITLVQNISKDKGPYKKTLVMDLIKRLVAEIEYPPTVPRHTVLAFIDATLPDFIDVTISVATGDLDIGKKVRRVKRCFLSLC